MIKNIKNLIKNTGLALAVMATTATMSFAQETNTIGNQLGSISGETRIFGDFFMLIIGLAGVILLFMGIWGLKKYAEDSRQNPLTKPLILSIAGALMSGFSFFQGLLSGSLVGGTSDNTGTTTFTAPES